METWIILSIMAALISATRQMIGANRKLIMPVIFQTWIVSMVAGIIQLSIWIFDGSAQISDITLQISLWSLIPGFIAGIIGNFLFIYALKNGDFSLLSSFTGMGVLFSVIIEGLVFNRYPTTIGLIGMMIIIVGTIFLNVSKIKRKHSQKKYIAITIFAILLWTLGDIIAKEASAGQNLTLYGGLNRLLPALVITPYIVYKYWKETVSILKSSLPFVIAISVLPALQDMLRFAVLSETLVSYYTAIVKLQIFFAVILGHIFYREKEYMHRLEASFVIVGGIVITTIF